jgi:carbon-monoxide dehydrogenase medium subunit
MKPSPFVLHRPATLAQALDLLASTDNGRVIAGGQSLMQEAILHVGHRQTRNRGTIGGSLCHLDPSAEMPTVMMALDASLLVQSTRGSRVVVMSAFAEGVMTTVLLPDEMLTQIRVRPWPDTHGAHFVEFARRHGDFAIVSAAALIEESGGKIARASVTLGGVAAAPVRMTQVEKALVGQKASDALFREACEACRKIEALEDVHAPASYRRHLAAVLSRRALEKAHERAAQ